MKLQKATKLFHFGSHPDQRFFFFFLGANLGITDVVCLTVMLLPLWHSLIFIVQTQLNTAAQKHTHFASCIVDS